jgi:hypothetical protein
MLAIVGLVLVWPLVHAGLVARYGIDPWELFGWSMYALPAPRVQVRVDVERGGETRPLRAMGARRQRVKAFARRRIGLGTFASPEPLARALLSEDATLDAVVIVTREISLDRKSARLVARDERHRFERERSIPPPG